MPHLLAVSLLWAFSFGLIKGRLAGLDSAFISAARLGLALLVFLPFFRWRGLNPPVALRLAALGAVQFGLMYLAYNESFRHLAAHEVALFTLTTPVFVTLIADACERRFRLRSLAAALVAVAGTAIVAFPSGAVGGTVAGLLLVQASNLAFAAGQIGYRQLRRQQPALRDREIFALPYAGGLALTAAVAFARVDFGTFSLTASQMLTLAYLGVLASGLGFFLWNIGVTRASPATSAVMNNAKIPLAVVCSLVFFGESADPGRLVASLAVLGLAVWLAGDPSPAQRR